MPQRRRTAFADILRVQPDPLVETSDNRTEVSENAVLPSTSKAGSAKRNKAVSPEYTKLTAYIPRTLAAAIKMSMALDQTADQSEYIERALSDWLRSKGRDAVLSQFGHSTSVV